MYEHTGKYSRGMNYLNYIEVWRWCTFEIFWTKKKVFYISKDVNLNGESRKSTLWKLIIMYLVAYKKGYLLN